MRRTDGVYIGIPECQHYIELNCVNEKTCCGGKKYPAAYIKCAVRGIMEAEIECQPMCHKFLMDYAKARR